MQFSTSQTGVKVFALQEEGSIQRVSGPEDVLFFFSDFTILTHFHNLKKCPFSLVRDRTDKRQ